MKGSMEPVRHSTVTYIGNLRSQRKGAAECPEMSVLVKEFLVLPLHMELMFCRRKGAHTVQNWDQFLWWIIIIHLCLPSLKILAWWPAGTYTEKECRARPHSAIPFQNQECFRSSGRADLCRQVQKSKLNLYWTFSLSDRHTRMLVRATLFLWHYLRDTSFPVVSSSCVRGSTIHARAVHWCGIWAAPFALMLFKNGYLFLEYLPDLGKSQNCQCFQHLHWNTPFLCDLVSTWKSLMKLKPWKYILIPQTCITNWKENVFFVFLLLIAKLHH